MVEGLPLASELVMTCPCQFAMGPIYNVTAKEVPRSAYYYECQSVRIILCPASHLKLRILHFNYTFEELNFDKAAF